MRLSEKPIESPPNHPRPRSPKGDRGFAFRTLCNRKHQVHLDATRAADWTACRNGSSGTK